MVEIKFKKLVEHAIIPSQANEGDAGWDIRAIKKTVLKPHGVVKVPTGIAVQIPNGYELQVRGKSGLALNEGMSIAQGIGTIDAGYRGEICVLVKNIKPFMKVIEQGEMVGQLVLSKVLDVTWKEVKTLDDSERGEKGFGSTKDAEKTETKKKTTEQVSTEDKKE